MWLSSLWRKDHPSNINAHLHNYVKLFASFCFVQDIERRKWFFKILMGHINNFPLCCVCVCVCVVGNWFPAIFSIRGRLTLLMANTDAELSSFLCLEHQSLESQCEASSALNNAALVFPRHLSKDRRRSNILLITSTLKQISFIIPLNTNRKSLHPQIGYFDWASVGAGFTDPLCSQRQNVFVPHKELLILYISIETSLRAMWNQSYCICHL